MMAVTPLRVLIVDDIGPVRDALATFLSSAENIEVVGAAADGLEAVEQARSLRPDVVLMDLEMPVLDGYDSTRRIVGERLAAVVALSIHTGPSTRDRALAAGAYAFVEKGETPDALLRALRSACHRTD